MHTTEISSDTENIIPFPSALNTKVEYHPTVVSTDIQIWRQR
jgi:hypothetical protein